MWNRMVCWNRSMSISCEVHSMVVQLAMTDRLMNVAHEESSQGQKAYRDQTNEEIDEEVRRVLSECTEKCRQLVRQKRQLIQELSDELLAKETVDLRDITRILGERPFVPKKNFKAYLEEM